MISDLVLGERLHQETQGEQICQRQVHHTPDCQESLPTGHQRRDDSDKERVDDGQYDQLIAQEFAILSKISFSSRVPYSA